MQITEDAITSTVTPHSARLGPLGWAVSWIPGSAFDRNAAITAMMIAETIASRDLDVDAVARISTESLAKELDLSADEAIRMVAETLPPADLHDTYGPLTVKAEVPAGGGA
jgi:hypothetical protein